MKVKIQSSAPAQGISPASHPDALRRLQEVRDLLVRSHEDLQGCLEAVLDAALFVTGAPRGNLQLFDGEGLRIAVQRGFERPFLDFFAIVRNEEDSACGTALEHATRVMVHDVKASDIFVGTSALAVLLEAQVRAVVSAPLVSSAGRVVGMVSTHFGSPHTPGERELSLLDLLARQAADYLERRASEMSRSIR
jgi:GAF domain-containing protein